MNTIDTRYVPFSPLDLYYLAITTNIFLYGFLTIMSIGFIGNACQILIFFRKTMRNVSTGVLFLALSISDMVYLSTCAYVVVIYGFQSTDRSNQNISCRIRHFFNYFTTNFSAWMLTIISCDRWIRTQFPLKAQTICTPRMAIYAILVAIGIDILLHVHLLTPLFSPIPAGVTASCGANPAYPSYQYFFNEFWPIITIMTVTIIPAALMVAFVLATIINIHTRRNRVLPIHQQSNINAKEKRRANFMHRQMFILMVATLILFFFTTLPVALFRFAIATLKIQQPFSLSLLLAAIFGLITAANYALNFYLHTLTSKLFRRELFRLIPCSISIRFTSSKNSLIDGTATQQYLTRTQNRGAATQSMAQ